MISDFATVTDHLVKPLTFLRGPNPNNGQGGDPAAEQPKSGRELGYPG
jgi:hypothetical protein